MSTAVNAVKGLGREELVETLAMPHRKPSEFLDAFEALVSAAWYMHRTPEDRRYFDRTENLTKLLQGLATDAPEAQIDDLIRDRLVRMFKPAKRVVYTEVLALPEVERIAERVKKTRPLLIVSPESKLPPEQIQRLFENVTEKNNVCVLTGDQTKLGSVEAKARQVYAAHKADSRIPKGHPQREELDKKLEQYERDLLTTILGVFDKVMFPAVMAGKPVLRHKPLQASRDHAKPFNGEDQIEKTLLTDPAKLVDALEDQYGMLREKAETLLWPSGQPTAPWKDIVSRAETQAGFPWLTGSDLEQLRELACNRGHWEDLGNGHLTKAPQPKRTGVQVTQEEAPDDDGIVRLKVNALNAGPSPKVHFAEDGEAKQTSPLLQGTHLPTKALRVSFLVVDSTGKYPTGDIHTWRLDHLRIRNEVVNSGKQRAVTLTVAPRGALKYTLDGRSARNGDPYTGPIVIGTKAQKISGVRRS